MKTSLQAILRCVTVVAGAALLWGGAPALAHEEEGEGDGHILPHSFEGFPGIQLDGGVTWFLQSTSGNGTNDSTDLTYTMDLNLTGTVSETGHVHIALEAGNGAGVDARLGSLSTANYDAFITEVTTGSNEFNAPSISQVYYEGEYGGGRYVVDFGKLDVHAMYDDNAYANDETDQFLSGIFTRSAGTSYSELDQYYAPGRAVTAAAAESLDVMALVRGAEARVDTPVEPVAEPVQEDRGVRTVMIVDDSVTVRKVTSRLMERQGWEVVTAKDGIEAMSHLQEMYPDIMLLDIEMPRMDGFEVLRAVRRDERLKELPIIMITSRTGEKHRQQALELGVNRFLGKPFQEANLLSNIEEVISSVKAQ